MQNKKLRVVSGIIYDDEYARCHGGSRFYHLNGDIETDEAGNTLYIESRKREDSSEFVDLSFPVETMPKLIQMYIDKYTQNVTDRQNAKYICIHSD